MAPTSSETALRELFALAEVEIGGSNPWDIQVSDPRFYPRVLQEKQLGLGKSYLEGWWECPAIDQMVTRLLKARLDTIVKGSWKIQLLGLQSKLINMQSSSRAYEVGERHYDLGNDLYKAMLDKRLNYTCAYWEDAAIWMRLRRPNSIWFAARSGLKRACMCLNSAVDGAASPNMPRKNTARASWG